MNTNIAAFEHPFCSCSSKWSCWRELGVPFSLLMAVTELKTAVTQNGGTSEKLSDYSFHFPVENNFELFDCLCFHLIVLEFIQHDQK